MLRVTDLSPGHLAQSSGLVKAVAAHARVTVHDAPTLSVRAALCAVIRGTPDAFPPDCKPHLIICCGHRTHLTGLALRRALGGRLVVLMRPSLPICMFDLVIAPRHDGLREGKHILLTDGVLNPFSVEGPHYKSRGLMMIGGPSRHYRWDDTGLISQLRIVMSANPGVQWMLTTSRRTPTQTLEKIRALNLSNLEVIPLELTGAGWVAGQLAKADVAWITEDSVSMVYEALTAGLAVGLVEVPAKSSSRVARGVETLVATGRVTRFSAWHPGDELKRQTPLAEADRIAAEILRRWYPEYSPSATPP